MPYGRSLPEPEPEPPRYRLWHLLYLTALVAAAIANLGGWGVLWTAATLGTWSVVFASQYRIRTLVSIVIVGVVILCCSGVLAPSVGSRPIPGFEVCGVNAMEIRLALAEYAQFHGSLPPACIRDASGRPMHSWRVLILPHLGQEDLYARYRFDEPWDGPNNRKLMDEMPEAYHCRTHSAGHESTTSYVVVTGPHTLFPDQGTASVTGWPDDPERTVLFVEHAGLHIPWTEPRDLPLAEAITLVTNPHDLESESGHIHDRFLVYHHAGPRVFTVGNSWGREDLLPSARAEAAKLFCIDDGNPAADSLVGDESIGRYTIDWNNLVRLVLLLGITFAPLPWAIYYWEWPPRLLPRPPDPTFPPDFGEPTPSAEAR